jgi:gas vesicle protein
LNLSGGIQIGKIGGKFAAEGVAGEIAIGFVGGRARVSRLGGALSLEDVGGAVELAGPFPLDKTWIVRSRGRINVEVDPNASLELDASAGWGRVRVYGIEAPGLKWADKNHVHGPIGPDPSAGARTKVAVETSGADVIVASADAREREFSGRGYRSRAGASFAAPFEDLVDDLGGEIPQFVRSVLDAAGQFVAESGGLSSGIVREVTRDVKRSVSEGLREVERAIEEVQERVPEDVGEKLSRLGKDIGDLLAQTVRGGSSEARSEMRERVRQAAREMRDKIREAARDLRSRSHSESATARSESEKPTTESPTAKFAPGGTAKLSREDAILEILAAVKDGRLEPDEADDLINAWMEVDRGDDAHR